MKNYMVHFIFNLYESQTKQGRDKCGHIFFYLARIPQMSRKCLSTMRDELHPISPAAAPNKISWEKYLAIVRFWKL
jgi:hypothetical protein